MQLGTIADWSQTVITLVVGFVAWRAFVADRHAVRVTQRADVLLKQFVVNPGTTEVLVAVKNFGPTRASKTLVTIQFWIAAPMTPSPPPQTFPLATVASQGTYEATFPSLYATFGAANAAAAFRGDLPLRFRLKIRYKDVFGEAHASECSGRWHPRHESFLVDEDYAD